MPAQWLALMCRTCSAIVLGVRRVKVTLFRVSLRMDASMIRAITTSTAQLHVAVQHGAKLLLNKMHYRQQRELFQQV